MPVNVGGRDSISSSECNQEQSPFLRLPAELRNQIYGYAYETAIVEANRSFKAHGHEYVVGNDGVIKRCPQPRVVRKVPELSLVCRQIHQESAPFSKTYSRLEIQGTATFSILMDLFGRRSDYLHAVREIQLSEDVMVHVLNWYVLRQTSRSNGSRWHEGHSQVFPALEVIVWKCSDCSPVLGYHKALPLREAAVRFCFCKPSLRLIDA